MPVDIMGCLTTLWDAGGHNGMLAQALWDASWNYSTVYILDACGHYRKPRLIKMRKVSL